MCVRVCSRARARACVCTRARRGSPLFKANRFLLCSFRFSESSSVHAQSAFNIAHVMAIWSVYHEIGLFDIIDEYMLKTYRTHARAHTHTYTHMQTHTHGNTYWRMYLMARSQTHTHVKLHTRSHTEGTHTHTHTSKYSNSTMNFTLRWFQWLLCRRRWHETRSKTSFLKQARTSTALLQQFLICHLGRHLAISVLSHSTTTSHHCLAL